MIGPVETARASWAPELPDWVLVMAEACEATSQAKVAAQLGRSPALVSCVIKNKYEGSLANVEELVRGVFMRAVVACPAQGEIATHDCAAWRKRARNFSGHNALRVQMYRACTRCPRFRGSQEGAPDA